MYLCVKITLGAVFADDEGLRLVDLASGIGELAHLDLVGVAYSRSDVNAEGRVRDVLVVEFHSYAVLACVSPQMEKNKTTKLAFLKTK